MNCTRLVLSATAIGLALVAGAPAHADSAMAGAGTDGSAPWQDAHHRDDSGFRRVLQQLGLAPEQQTQVNSVLAQSEARLRTLRESMNVNRSALAIAAPTDPGYPALLTATKANAADLIQAASDLKTQIYAILTPVQQARIPALLTAARGAEQARFNAWRDKLLPRG